MSNPKNAKVNIVPSLRYADAAKAIDWLCDAFGFERQLVVPGENGTIVHAQLGFGNGMLMLGSGGGHEGTFDQLVRPPKSPKEPRPSSIYVIVEDADAHYARAAAAGAEMISELEDPEYGGRAYTCSDLEDNVWTFGTYDPNAEHAEG
jgi:uncharacterized glyoxalase superfamily protein PhnB